MLPSFLIPEEADAEALGDPCEWHAINGYRDVLYLHHMQWAAHCQGSLEKFFLNVMQVVKMQRLP